jgi:hypothetical protein
MLDGEVEQDKRHRAFRYVIVLSQTIVGTLLEQGLVLNFNVWSVSQTEASVKITEKETSELIESAYFTVLVEVEMGEH